MLILHLDIQQDFMIVTLSSGLLEPFHFIFVQSPAHGVLEFSPADLLTSLLLFRCFQLGLEPCLHPDAKGGVERRGVSIAADLRRSVGPGRLLDGKERIPQRLYLEGPRGVRRGDATEGFARGHGFHVGGQQAELVAGEVPGLRRQFALGGGARAGTYLL